MARMAASPPSGRLHARAVARARDAQALALVIPQCRQSRRRSGCPGHGRGAVWWLRTLGDAPSSSGTMSSEPGCMHHQLRMIDDHSRRCGGRRMRHEGGILIHVYRRGAGSCAAVIAATASALGRT